MISDQQLRAEWLALKEAAFNRALLDGEPSKDQTDRLAALKREMERRGLKL